MKICKFSSKDTNAKMGSLPTMIYFQLENYSLKDWEFSPNSELLRFYVEKYSVFCPFSP